MKFAYVRELYKCKVVGMEDGNRNALIVGTPNFATVQYEDQATPLTQCAKDLTRGVNEWQLTGVSGGRRPTFTSSNPRTLGVPELRRLVEAGAATLP